MGHTYTKKIYSLFIRNSNLIDVQYFTWQSIYYSENTLHQDFSENDTFFHTPRLGSMFSKFSSWEDPPGRLVTNKDSEGPPLGSLTSFPGESYKQATLASMALIQVVSFPQPERTSHTLIIQTFRPSGEVVPYHHPHPRADLIQLLSECLLLFTDFYCSTF